MMSKRLVVLLREFVMVLVGVLGEIVSLVSILWEWISLMIFLGFFVLNNKYVLVLENLFI